MAKIIDLSMMIEEGMQTFAAPWHPFCEITQLARHGIENRETRKLTMGTHCGTHLDAPRHFIPAGETIETIDIARTVGDAIVLDFTHLDFYHEITVDELKSAIGDDKGDMLIFHFGWDSHLGTSDYYVKHPFLSEEACHFIVEKNFKLIALDAPQPDNPLNGRNSDKDAPNHKILLGNDVLIAEYLVNIGAISKKVCKLFAVPLKLNEGDGAPIRCFVMED